MNLTPEKLRDGVMSLKHIKTDVLIQMCGMMALFEHQELKDLIAMELEQRHDPVTGLGMGGK